MARRERTTLEDFALKGNHLSKMTGVSVATHAIPDAFLLMHTGVGCKYKAAAQVGPHDWASHPNRREAWTQVGEVQLIKGSAERIAPFARAWYERRRPNFMPVVSAYFIELTGEDCRDVVASTNDSVPCDMAMITTAAPNGGFYDGYADVTLEVVKRIDWKVEPKTPRSATVLGYYFDRYEGDHRGNLSVLSRLLEVAGLNLGPVLLSGNSYLDLKKAGEAEHILSMPYLGKKRRRLRRTIKRDTVTVDLPMGMAGTAYFLRQLARETGGDAEVVETYIEEQTAATKEKLAILSDRARGLSLALFADGPLAAGLYTICTELGINVPYIGIREEWLGGKTGFLDILERWGVRLPEGEVVTQPSLRWTRKTIGRAILDGRVQGLIASAHETSLLRRPPHEPGKGYSIPRYFAIEVGFPSDDHHAAVDLPTFGFEGMVSFAQRVIDQHLKPV